MKLDFKIKFSGNTYYYTYISRNKYRFKSIGQQIIPYIQQFSHSRIWYKYFLPRGKNIKKKKKKEKEKEKKTATTVARLRLRERNFQSEGREGEKNMLRVARCFSKIAKYAKLFPRVGKSR